MKQDERRYQAGPAWSGSRTNRLGDFAQMVSGGLGLVAGAGKEMTELLRARVNYVAYDLGLPSRDEFEALKEEVRELRQGMKVKK